MNDYIELVESSDIDEEDLSDPERAQANAAKDPSKITSFKFQHYFH